MADLAGEDFVEVMAYLDKRGTAVDITGAVLARLRSGVMVSLTGCGDTIKSCDSDVRVFCTKGILRTGVWGERLEVQRDGSELLEPVDVPMSAAHGISSSVCATVRSPTHRPPEIGLRMSKLWDAIQASAAQGGQVVKIGG
ncbi:MAG: hypothetical protein R2851_09910 [Caldilineaceae bacterium]